MLLFLRLPARAVPRYWVRPPPVLSFPTDHIVIVCYVISASGWVLRILSGCFWLCVVLLYCILDWCPLCYCLIFYFGSLAGPGGGLGFCVRGTFWKGGYQLVWCLAVGCVWESSLIWACFEYGFVYVTGLW